MLTIVNNEADWHHTREELRAVGYPDNFSCSGHLSVEDTLQLFPYAVIAPQDLLIEREARTWCSSHIKGNFSTAYWGNIYIKKYYKIDNQILDGNYKPIYIYMFAYKADHFLFKLTWSKD